MTNRGGVVNTMNSNPDVDYPDLPKTLIVKDEVIELCGGGSEPDPETIQFEMGEQDIDEEMNESDDFFNDEPYFESPVYSRLRCDPLIGEDYDHFRTSYAKVVGETIDNMDKRVSKVFENLSDKQMKDGLSILTVGSHVGYYVSHLQKSYDLKIKFIYAQESDKNKLSSLGSELAQTGAQCVVDKSEFNQNFMTFKKFDFVFISQLQKLDHPDEALLKAESLLARNGKLVIFTNLENTLNALIQEHCSYSRPPIENNGVNSYYLSQILARNNIAHQISVFPSYIDMSEFLSGVHGSDSEKVVSYFMQTDHSKLPSHIQSMVQEFVRNMCVGSKKNLLPHSDAIIVVD